MHDGQVQIVHEQLFLGKFLRPATVEFCAEPDIVRLWIVTHLASNNVVIERMTGARDAAPKRIADRFEMIQGGLIGGLKGDAVECDHLE